MKYDFELDMNNENSISIILKQIKPNTCVLEFGPAMGRMTKYLKEELNCKVYIIELDTEGFNSSMRFAVDGYLGNADKKEWLEKFKNMQFDYVIFADVLEHLRNPEEVVLAARNLLKREGKLILSVPNIAHNSVIINLINNRFDYKDIGLLDNTHIKFFTYYTLQEMLARCNLTIVEENATYAQPFETEFGNNFEDLPDELSMSFKLKEYGDVYQFVFTCIKKEDYLLNEEEVIITKSVKRLVPKDTFKIYINQDNGYNENNIIVKNIFQGNNNLKFDISKFTMIKEIRLDFTEKKCILKLNHLSIDGKYYDVNSLSGNFSYKLDNYYLFFNKDPFLFVLDLDTKCCELCIDFTIYGLINNELENQYLGCINSQLNNNYNVINEKELEISEIRKIMDEREKIIDAKKYEISEKEKIIDEKEKIIVEQTYEINKKEKIIDEKMYEINEKEKIINEKNYEFNEKEKIIEEKTYEIYEKNNEIIRLNNEITTLSYYKNNKIKRFLIRLFRR